MKTRFIKITAILFIALCSGCVTPEYLKSIYDNPGWPGFITSTKSDFDNKSMSSMEAAYLYDGSSSFRLGLRWSSGFKKDSILLVAEWLGAKNFEPKATLDINIDGEIISLKPSDPRQYGITSEKIVISSGLMDVPVSQGNQTHKTYWVTRQTLERMINAKKVVVRVQLLNSYWEERFEPSTDALPTYNKYPYIWAKAAFKKFLNKIPS